MSLTDIYKKKKNAENTLYKKHNSKSLPKGSSRKPAYYTNSLIGKEHFLFSDNLFVLPNNHQITKDSILYIFVCIS